MNPINHIQYKYYFLKIRGGGVYVKYIPVPLLFSVLRLAESRSRSVFSRLRSLAPDPASKCKSEVKNFLCELFVLLISPSFGKFVPPKLV